MKIIRQRSFSGHQDLKESPVCSSTDYRLQLDNFPVAPEPLNLIKLPAFFREDVNDEIQVIQKDPVSAIVAFNVGGADVFLFL